jgi:hypothetical protein
MKTDSAKPVTSDDKGVAAKAITVAALSSGQTATADACLNGTTECVSFNATGVSADAAVVEGVSGTKQSLAHTGTPDQIVLRVRDSAGNPMAGASVRLSQAVYAWSPPCPPHGRCAQPELLANQVASAVSGIDGTVSFAPASVPGVATNTLGIAAAGSTSAVGIAVERRP